MLVDFIALIRKDEAGMETTVTLALDWTVTDSIPADLWEWYFED